MLFRTIIENVFSGSGSDDAFGNDADNEIHAGAGDDLITGVQAMTHFWGNPITTRYLVKRGNPIYGALRFMCPTLPTLGPAAAPIFVQTRHTMPLLAWATFLMEPRQQAAFWAVSLAQMGKMQGHSWKQAMQTRLNFAVISSPSETPNL
ncbi:MAG: hypothetical protein EBZ20_01425 [Rhodobacteraceae bacterium]|nr:hypothetical protein [Paracoccaceae bacterium]